MQPDKKELRFQLVVILLFLLTALGIWFIYDYKIREMEAGSYVLPSK